MPYWIAGIDVHKKMLAVVVADVEVDGDFHFEPQKVGTTPADLRRLADWLVAHEVEEVVMESTAQYWRPVWEARCDDARSRGRPVVNMYRLTVHGDTLIPSLSCSSAAVRSSPHVAFARAMVAIRRCTSTGSGGRPQVFDFHRHKRRNLCGATESACPASRW
jgi:hypothetical protein